MSSKGLDYPMERFLRSGRPFNQVITVASGETTGVSQGIVKPSSEDFVVYIRQIGVRINVEAGTNWELVIKSPESTWHTSSANNDGSEIASLLTDVFSAEGAGTGIVYTGVIQLDSLTPAYFYKKDARLVAAVGGAGGWEVLIGANTTDDGTDNISTTFTFQGVEVRKKRAVAV